MRAQCSFVVIGKLLTPSTDPRRFRHGSGGLPSELLLPSRRMILRRGGEPGVSSGFGTLILAGGGSGCVSPASGAFSDGGGARPSPSSSDMRRVLLSPRPSCPAAGAGAIFEDGIVVRRP